MRTFLDTSVLIASSDADHPHQAASIGYLASASPATTACAAHTLAEFYSVLSRLPGGKRVRPELAAALVVQIAERMTVVPLTAEDYIAAISACAAAGQSGAMVYDALLIACARRWSADRIVTWNLRHFRSIALDMADRIFEPEGHPVHQP